MAEVRLTGVSKHFGEIEAVNDLSLTVADGELLVLLGPTGAGKTTTLRLVAGLETPDKGSVHIGGVDMTRIAPSGRDVAFVFQQYSLYPHLSVFDNLAFPLRSPTRRRPEDEIRRTVTEIAEMLQIGDKLANRATSLSGGQMQRVAIGRALVRQPAAFLMDEPLSSLDAKLRSDLRLELKRIQRQLGATILYVTHDQIEAMTLATRIGVVREGRLVQIGSPRAIYEDPIDTYVATRLGQPAINLIPADLLPAEGVPAGAAMLGARTEHMEVTKAVGEARGRVTRVEHLGDQSHLHVDLGRSRIVALVDPDTDLRRDDPVDVRLKAPLAFDAAGQRLKV